jgi:hypothetical protein
MSSKKKMRMRAQIDKGLRALVLLCALGLGLAFFRPWVMSPGGGVAAPQLRETLQGPQKFLSFFNKNNRLSRNHALTPYLWSIPIGAGVVGVIALLPAGPALPGLLVGAMTAGEAAYVRQEVKGIPFHHEGPGVRLTQRLGYFLTLLSLVRFFTRRVKSLT